MNAVSPDPSGITEDIPTLRPGTYELTKRIEVGEDGQYRFVDVPDGPDTEYVKGFWHKTRSRVRHVHSDAHAADGVDVHVTEYDVSILPRDDINRSSWSVTVSYRGKDRYAVLYGARRCLSRAGSWDYEAIPSERTDEWIAEHRFPLDEALRLAVEYAPKVVCNGKTAVELLEWLRERESSGVAGGGAR